MGLSDTKVYLAAAAGLAAGLGLAALVKLAKCNKKCKASASAGPMPEILTANGSALTSRKSLPDARKREGFVQVFKDIQSELVKDLELYGLSKLVAQPLERMLEYNVPGGKLNRGLTVVETAVAVRRALGTVSTEEETELMKKAAVLGWCIEWMQASFLVSDDLMDSSITRRGQPCWYRNADVGMIAVNDALILMTQFEVLLHKYFGHDSALFMELHRIITETTYQTEMGQMLDLTTQPPQGPINLALYTEERHELIVKYKTAFYSFYAPIALGMVVAGVRDKDSLRVALDICVKMGVYFQVQDDYLDCYGAPEVIGKVGTDIQDSKCSWLVVQALQTASAAQKQVIFDNYGKDDEACISRVKAVFMELELEAKYHAYEEKVYKELVEMIEGDVKTVPKEIYFSLLNKIYKRSK